MIEFRRVSKTYKTGTVALNKVNFSVEQGEFVFLTGASGAGKTSIVKLLLCEEQPTSGDIYINGKNIRRLSRRQIPKYRRQIGVVFQDFRLIPSMNVFDNVAFAMRAVGRSYWEIRRRVAATLDIVNLSDKRKSFPDQLSGGEQQRVALARAIVNAPKIIIADEPTGNLDGKLSFEMMKMLDYINSTGITVLVVTHADNLVNYFGKRTIVLNNGQIVKDIPAEERNANKQIPETKASAVMEPEEGTEETNAEPETSVPEAIAAEMPAEVCPESQESEAVTDVEDSEEAAPQTGEEDAEEEEPTI